MPEETEIVESTVNTKTVVVLEVEKNERLFSFSVPVGTPFKDAYEGALSILQGIAELSKKAEEEASQKEESIKEVQDNTEEEKDEQIENTEQR